MRISASQLEVLVIHRIYNFHGLESASFRWLQFSVLQVEASEFLSAGLPGEMFITEPF